MVRFPNHSGVILGADPGGPDHPSRRMAGDLRIGPEDDASRRRVSQRRTH